MASLVSGQMDGCVMGFLERSERILALLSVRSSLSIQQLTGLVGCSEATMRRDAMRLEREGTIERYWGGIRRKETSDTTVRGLDLQNLRPDVSHMAIGRTAAGLIRPGEFIFVGSGTTTLAMVPFVRRRDISVATNGIPQLEALSRVGVKTLLLGGFYKQFSRSLVGKETLDVLRSYRFDRAFFGVNGIGDDWSLLSADEHEDEIKRLCIQHSRRAYALASADKFGMSGLHAISVADAFETEIITDRRPGNSDAWKKAGGAWHASVLNLAVGE